MSAEATMQNQTVLAPLAAVLESFALAVEPVEPIWAPLPDAIGRTLAADVGAFPADGGGEVIRFAGARLRRIDGALMAALGVERVAIRVPRVTVVTAAADAPSLAVAQLVAAAIGADGGDARVQVMALDQALSAGGADAVFGLSGAPAEAVAALERCGGVTFDGIAIRPGEGAALGHAGGRPVLLLPGDLDAALSGWLTVGRRLLARLAFRLIEEQPFPLELSRAVVSPRGFAEVIPVRRRASTVEPLASGSFGPQVLARSDGWILVPADSEGQAAGSRVVVRPWP